MQVHIEHGDGADHPLAARIRSIAQRQRRQVTEQGGRKNLWRRPDDLAVLRTAVEVQCDGSCAGGLDQNLAWRGNNKPAEVCLFASPPGQFEHAQEERGVVVERDARQPATTVAGAGARVDQAPGFLVAAARRKRASGMAWHTVRSRVGAGGVLHMVDVREQLLRQPWKLADLSRRDAVLLDDALHGDLHVAPSAEEDA